MTKKKIIHITSAHPINDIRIYHKQCLSLKKKYEVSLFVADGLGNKIEKGINIHDIGIFKSRILRIFLSSFKFYFYFKKNRINADLYHFHDPELLFLGILLKIKKKKVVFDAHEHLIDQLKSKYYLNTIFKIILSFVIYNCERIFFRRFDAVVAATPFIKKYYQSINCKKVMNVNNYPKIDYFNKKKNFNKNYRKKICYIGSVSYERGLKEMIQAMYYVKSPIKLIIAGSFHQGDIKKLIIKSPKIEYIKSLSRKEIKKFVSNCFIGLSMLNNDPNHKKAQPNKVYEYMASGIPFVAHGSDVVKDLVKRFKCGIVIKKMNPKLIAKSIDYLYENISISKVMGKNGFNAVKKKFNWKFEEKKLLDMYESLF